MQNSNYFAINNSLSSDAPKLVDTCLDHLIQKAQCQENEYHNFVKIPYDLHDFKGEGNTVMIEHGKPYYLQYQTGDLQNAIIYKAQHSANFKQEDK